MAVKPKVHLRTEKDNSKNIKTAEYIWHGHRPCEGINLLVDHIKGYIRTFENRTINHTVYSFAEPMAQI